MKKLPPYQPKQVEEEILNTWHKEKTFEQSLEKTKDGKPFSFYDGPPFANGLPHFGHSLVTSIKDSIGRYQTMRGRYVARRNGWDCHGLPVEFEIEKKFNVSGKKQIMELGLEKFNQACRDSVFTYKKEWEDFFDRIGRWTDTEHAYATQPYIALVQRLPLEDVFQEAAPKLARHVDPQCTWGHGGDVVHRCSFRSCAASAV
jgi:isoleucyl-tRNA synthetase